MRLAALRTGIRLTAVLAPTVCSSPCFAAGSPVTFAAFGNRVIAPGKSSGVSDGDTWDSAWSADNSLFFQHNDGTGFDNGEFVHDRICALAGTPQNPPSLLGTDLNPGALSVTLNGSSCYSTGLYEVDGVLYHNVCYSQQTPGAFAFYNTSTIKSVDGGKNWINHLGQTNVMPPNSSSQCMFPSENWGEVNFVKYGEGGAAPAVDNAQTYVYLCAAYGNCELARVARTNLPNLNPAQIQYYVGGDGMLDSSWTNNIARSVAIPTPTISPTGMVYNEPLGRYIMTSFASDSWQTPPVLSSLRVMEAPHPWGPWTQVLDENVNNCESDNLTWAFLVPKFTSPDGQKMWMSVAGRSPYGLQFVPIYLTTSPVTIQQAEAAKITGGVIANSVAGYSGSGYVSGLNSPGKKCEFTFEIATPGVYIIQFRYNTTNNQNLGLYVNGQSRETLQLGTSEQVYATWTSMSAMTWLAGGTNLIGLQCVDSSGNINLDSLSLAFYSSNTIPGLRAGSTNSSGGVALSFDPIPNLSYSVDWSSNLREFDRSATRDELSQHG